MPQELFYLYGPVKHFNIWTISCKIHKENAQDKQTRALHCHRETHLPLCFRGALPLPGLCDASLPSEGLALLCPMAGRSLGAT